MDLNIGMVIENMDMEVTYIPGRWKDVAKKLIKIYSLNNNSKILDVGCGKAFLLYEIKLILQKLKFVVLIYQVMRSQKKTQ